MDEIKDIPIKDIPNEIKNDKTGIAFYKALNILSKKVLFLTAATGLGKTYQFILKIIENFHQDKPSTLFCSTLTEVDRAIGLLKKQLPRRYYGEISRITSTKSGGDSNEFINLGTQVGMIAVSTYAYLDMTGEIARLYKIAEKLTTDRYIYCDEAHELYLKSIICYPLAARYIFKAGEDGGTYRLFQKCPKNARKANCKNCFLGYLKEALGPNNERDFYRSIPEGAFTKHAEHPVLPANLSWGLIESTKRYSRISSTLFYQPLEIEPVYNLNYFKPIPPPGEMDPAKMYSQFITARATHLYNPHLRIELPLINKESVNETGQPVRTIEPINPKAIEFLADKKKANIQ